MSAKKTIPVPQITAVLIKPSGEVSVIQIDGTLQALWNTVGGYVERIALRDGADLFVNEEGRPLGLPRNELANDLFQSCQKGMKRGVIVGDALVLGEVTPSGESTDVPDWVYEHLTR